MSHFGEIEPYCSAVDRRRDWSGADFAVNPASMSNSLRLSLSITDIVFLAYWLVSALHLAGVLPIPADWLYADADDPRVVAWNWSFLPLDLAFSLTGLTAHSVRPSRKSTLETAGTYFIGADDGRRRDGCWILDASRRV
jgi:hypothetical protein